MPNQPKALIYDSGICYRPAGYRIPFPDEIYISKTGKITKSVGRITDGVRLIVRQYDPEKDFK
jgi:hypothetical protein